MAERTPETTFRCSNWTEAQLYLAAYRAAGFSPDQVAMVHKNTDTLAFYPELRTDPDFDIKMHRMLAYQPVISELFNRIDQELGAEPMFELRYSKSRNKMCIAFVLDDEFQNAFREQHEKKHPLPDTAKTAEINAWNEGLKDAFAAKVTSTLAMLKESGVDAAAKALRYDDGKRHLAIEVALDETLFKLAPGEHVKKLGDRGLSSSPPLP